MVKIVKKTQKHDENQIVRIDCEEMISGRGQPTPKFNLEELVSQMPREYKAEEESFGKVVGLEEW